MRWAMMIFVVSGISVAERACGYAHPCAVSTALVESSRMRIFGFFSSARRDAEALLLAAGDVRAALLDVGVVAVREGAR